MINQSVAIAFNTDKKARKPNFGLAACRTDGRVTGVLSFRSRAVPGGDVAARLSHTNVLHRDPSNSDGISFPKR